MWTWTRERIVFQVQVNIDSQQDSFLDYVRMHTAYGWFCNVAFLQVKFISEKKYK